MHFETETELLAVQTIAREIGGPLGSALAAICSGNASELADAATELAAAGYSQAARLCRERAQENGELASAHWRRAGDRR